MGTLELNEGTIRHRDKAGNALTLMEWTKLYEDSDYRTVAETSYLDALVRTMWEGIDDGVDVACQFHAGIKWAGTWTTVWEGYWPCTEDEARQKHREIVAMLRKLCPKPPQAKPERLYEPLLNDGAKALALLEGVKQRLALPPGQNE